MKKRYAAGLALALVGILSVWTNGGRQHNQPYTGGGNDRRPEWQTD